MSMSLIAVGNEELVKAGRTSSLIFSEFQALRGREGDGLVSPFWGSLGEYKDTGRFSSDTSVFAHELRSRWPKRSLTPGGGRSGQGSNRPVSPCWGSLGENRDTGRFSEDTSVFAHGAKVMVAKTVVDPWGKAEVTGVKSAGVPVLGESWGVRGHQKFLGKHLKLAGYRHL
jgi:hypothetical protein